MADLKVGHHDGVKAEGPRGRKHDPGLLVLTMEDVVHGHSFETACFRHLTKEAEARAKNGRYTKTIIMHASQRKVIMKDGKSTRPYYETPKGQRLRWAEED